MAEDGPKPASTTERILDIALHQVGSAAQRVLDKRLARAGYSKKDVRKIARREGFAKRFAAATVARLATRSVPGALAVSGAVAARALFGRLTSRGQNEAPEVVEDPEE